MKNKFFIVLLIVIISGCNVSNAANFATPTPQVPTPSPFFKFKPSPTPINTPSPIAATLTPTFPPYTGEPFSIVFTRSGNLWIASMGETVTERQLTFEPPEMRVISFDVSPDETRIAYVPYQLEPLNSLVKVVDITTGESKVILGENDPFSEVRVVWIDDTRIAYKNQDSLASSFVTKRVRNVTKYIVYDLARKTQVQVTGYDALAPSPNKQVWLGCFAGAEGCGRYALQYAGSSTQYRLERTMQLGWFLDWSADSQYLLFNTVSSPDVCVSQLILIDIKTLEEKAITPKEESVWSGSFSPVGNLLVYEQAQIANLGLCQSGKLDYWLLDLDTQQPYKIPVEFQKDVWGFDWTPNGKRLLFFHDSYSGREHQLWSMNLDGSDLKPILVNVEEFQVLSKVP